MLVGVNPSLLNAPIYVLGTKASKHLDCIEVKWEQKIKGELVNKAFRFIRAATDPLPTVTHAKYLDILLAMYSQNWNTEGILHFRYCDVLRIAGKAQVSRAREAIQQTILRYHRHTTEWENSWNGRRDTLTFNIIRRSSIFDANGNITHSSSRRSKKKEDWHTVIFDKEIVSALKDEKKRILLTELFQKLGHDTFCVYRYYYGYPDYYLQNGTPKKNIIWRNVEDLRNTFKWTGQRNRFYKWLETRFEDLVDLDLIDEPIWNNGAVGIHCRNLKEQQKKNKHTVCLLSQEENHTKTSKGNRSKITRKFDPSKLTDQAIVEEYIVRKGMGLLSKETVDAIDLLLDSKLTGAAVNFIKSSVLN